MVKINDDSRATIRTSMGDIVLEFLDDKAPNTVENFVKLANKGFYDGLTFHRVMKGFMIQGGCPKGNGSGNPGYTIRPEFNDTPHVQGTVSMARSNDPHSAGSQFFICQGEARYLDGRYTVFAHVVEGQDVVEKISEVPVNMETRFQEVSVPRTPVYINTVKVDNVEFDDPLPPPRPQREDGSGDTSGDGGGAGGGESSGGREPSSGGGRSRGRGRGRGRGRNRGAGGDTAGDAKAVSGSGDPTGDRGGDVSGDRQDDSTQAKANDQGTPEADGPAKKAPKKASRSKPAAAKPKAAARVSAKASAKDKDKAKPKADDKPKPRAKKAAARKTTRKTAKKTTRAKDKDSE